MITAQNNIIKLINLLSITRVIHFMIPDFTTVYIYMHVPKHFEHNHSHHCGTLLYAIIKLLGTSLSPGINMVHNGTK